MRTISNDWNHPDAERLAPYKFKQGNEVPVIKVNSIHALNQLVGYVKYLNQDDGKVYFRGQCQLYDSLIPSLYRGCKTASSVGGRNGKIAAYVRDCSSKVRTFSSINEIAKEPLLQHYGIKTRWLDLVDNLWVALWFSVHHYKTKTSDRVYEFVIPAGKTQTTSYLLLVHSDAMTVQPNCPGIYRGADSDLVDLRVAVPSIFLRPHCQHALLMKPRRMNTPDDVDLSTKVCAIIQLDTFKVKEWIGSGRLLTAENIYPPPIYDDGYSLLLEEAPHRKEDIKNFGSITSMSYAAPNCA